ncbi:MAG: alpha/beta hydrolase [Betaproteobacteria bacterium]
MATFECGGIAMYYEVHGRGTPMLLIAGLAADNAFWLPVLATLSAQHQVIVLDNRGCGRTTPLDAGLSIRMMADDAMALVHHLQLTKVDLVGHSMGGMIAQQCAVQYPDLVDHLVLAATGPINSGRNNDLFDSWVKSLPTLDRTTWFRNLFYWVLTAKFFDRRQTVDALVELAAAYPWQQSTAALRNQVAAIAAFDGTDSLPSIRARTMVLAGTDDLLFPVASSAAWVAAIPRATLVEMAGVGHSIPIEFPEEFSRRVLDFVTSPPAR